MSQIVPIPGETGKRAEGTQDDRNFADRPTVPFFPDIRWEKDPFLKPV